VSDAQESKNMILDLLAGKTGPARDIVLLNAGAAIYVSGIASTLADRIKTAAAMLDSGKAMQKLQALISTSNA
jgi:anthranilate phosphoribosyltransferase